MRRVLGRIMRAPVVLDRRGFRWLLSGLSPAPVVVLVHRGRQSGRLYKTPVEAIVEDRERDEIIVSPMWGERSDWYRNVLAGGLVEVRRRGEARGMEWRRLSERERRDALSAYRRDHPVYAPVILRVLVRLHGFSGEPLEAVALGLPMLVLHSSPDGQ